MNDIIKNLSKVLESPEASDLTFLCADRATLETKIYEILVNCQFSRLEDLLDEYAGADFTIARAMEEMEGKYGIIVDFIFEIGYILGLIHLSEKIGKQKRTDNKILKARSGYRDIILKRIYENNGPIMHKELAEELGISPSNLSNVIQRILTEEVQLIQINSMSKYKYYNLTDRGREYVENHLNNNNIFIASYYNQQMSLCANHNLFNYLNEYISIDKRDELDLYLNDYFYYNSKIPDRKKNDSLFLNKEPDLKFLKKTKIAESLKKSKPAFSMKEGKQYA